MGRPVTKSQLAGLAGVTPAAITQQINKGNLALTPDDKLDLDHPTVIAYLATKGVKSPALPLKRGRKAGRKPKGPPTAPPPPPGCERDPNLVVVDVPGHAQDPYRDVRGLDLDVAVIQEMKLREIVRRWGSMPSLVDYAKALLELEKIQEKRDKNDKYRGALVPRDAVAKVFKHVDNAHAVLLADAPAKLSVLIRTMFPASEDGPTQEELENTIREDMSKALKACKSKVQTAIGKMRATDDAGD